MREKLLILFMVSLLVAACATSAPFQLQLEFGQARAYIAGRFAASRGEPMENNPHHYTNPDHLFREWQEGWQAGQQKTVDGGQDPGGDIELLGR